MAKSFTSKSILVTGGAGCIGSHVAKLLDERSESIVVLDNLSTGNADAVLYSTFVPRDTGGAALVSRLIDEHRLDTVMHFAAHTIVTESVEDPLRYYRNNTANTLSLLQCCQAAGVGMSRLMSEHLLKDLSRASPLRHVILRYFNVAGPDPDGPIGQSTRNATARLNDKPLNVKEQARRAGDPPALIAAVDKIHRTLDWQPKFDHRDTIVQSSLDWDARLMPRAQSRTANPC